MPDPQTPTVTTPELTRDQKRKQLQLMQMQEKDLPQYQSGMPPNVRNEEVTIAPGASPEEHERTRAIEIAPAALGTAGGIAGFHIGSKIGLPNVGEAIGSFGGEMIGSAYSEGLKRIENPYLRGIMGSGLQREIAAEAAEQERRELAPAEAPEPDIGRFDPANPALHRPFMDVMLDSAEQAGINTLAGAGMMKLGKWFGSSKATPLKDIASNLKLSDDVPAFELTSSAWTGILGKSWPRLTRPGREILSRQYDKLAKKINNKFKAIGDHLGSKYDNTPEGNMLLGKELQIKLKQANESVRKPLSDSYDEFFDAIAPKMRAIKSKVQVPSKILDPEGNPFTRTETVIDEVLEGGVWTDITTLKSMIKSNWETPSGMTMPKTDEGDRLLAWAKSLPDRVPVGELAQARSEILGLARNSSPSRAVAIENNIAKEIDDNILATFKREGLTEEYAVLKSLNDQWRKYTEIHRINEVVALRRARRHELLARSLFKEGTKKGLGNETLTKTIFDALDDAAEPDLVFMGQVRRSAFEQVMTLGVKHHNMEGAMKDWWTNLTEFQQIRLAGSPERVTEMHKIVELIFQVSPSQTAANLAGANQNLIEYAKVAALSGAVVGTASGGISGIMGGDLEQGGITGGGGAVAGAIIAMFTPALVARLVISKPGTRLLRGALTDYYRAAKSSVGLNARDIVLLGSRLVQAERRTREIDNAGRIVPPPFVAESIL